MSSIKFSVLFALIFLSACSKNVQLSEPLCAVETTLLYQTASEFQALRVSETGENQKKWSQVFDSEFDRDFKDIGAIEKAVEKRILTSLRAGQFDLPLVTKTRLAFLKQMKPEFMSHCVEVMNPIVERCQEFTTLSNRNDCFDNSREKMLQALMSRTVFGPEKLEYDFNENLKMQISDEIKVNRLTSAIEKLKRIENQKNQSDNLVFQYSYAIRSGNLQAVLELEKNFPQLGNPKFKNNLLEQIAETLNGKEIYSWKKNQFEVLGHLASFRELDLTKDYWESFTSERTVSFAIRLDASSFIQALVKKGLLKNFKDRFEDNIAVMTVKKNALTTLKTLIQEKYPVETRDNFGRTLLHLAVENNRLEMTKFLLENDADPSLKKFGKWGPDALQVAKELKYPKLVTLLSSKGEG